MNPRMDFLRPQRPLFLAPMRLRIGLLALAGLLLAGAALDAAQWVSRRDEVQARQDKLRQKLARLEVAAPRPGNRPEAPMDAPWEAIFKAVERHRTGDIALLSLAADQGPRELILKGEARNLESLKVFVDGLSAESVFEQILPAGNKPTEPGSKTLSFDLKAKWH